MNGNINYGITNPELSNALVSGYRSSQQERNDRLNNQQAQQLNQLKIDSGSAELERLTQERQIMVDFQNQLKAAGKDTNLDTYFDTMISSGIPDYVEKGLVGKQKLNEQKQFAQIMGGADQTAPVVNQQNNVSAQIKSEQPQQINPIMDRINKLVELGTPQSMQTAKILQDQLEFSAKQQKGLDLSERFVPVGKNIFDRQTQSWIRGPSSPDTVVQMGNIDSQIPKLKQGEVYNYATGAVEAKPGSDVYVKQSKEHAKDYKAVLGTFDKINSSIDKVDKILEPSNKSAFSGNFGGYNAYGTRMLPGQNSDMRKTIESFKSDLKQAGLELMRQGGSIGQMTEKEWPIVEQMIASIDPVLSETEARTVFENIKKRFQKIRDDSKEVYDTQWGGTQYHKQIDKQLNNSAPLSDLDKQALDWANANQNDPRAIAIKKKLGVK